MDVKTIICNKTWWVFNDTNEKEVYIFQMDGGLIISQSGVVTMASWMYVMANRAIMVTTNGKMQMLNPKFVDNSLMVLQLDGTQECYFLIDENNKEHFAPKTLEQLEEYLEMKEQEEINRQRMRTECNHVVEKELRMKEELQKEKRQVHKLKQELKVKAGESMMCVMYRCFAVLLSIAILGGYLYDRFTTVSTYASVSTMLMVICSAVLYAIALYAVNRTVYGLLLNRMVRSYCKQYDIVTSMKSCCELICQEASSPTQNLSSSEAV